MTDSLPASHRSSPVRSVVAVLGSLHRMHLRARLNAVETEHEHQDHTVKALVETGRHGSDELTAAAEMSRSPQLERAMRKRWVALCQRERLQAQLEQHDMRRSVQ